MPVSIRRLSKFTNPIAGLKPRGAGLPSHNMISPVAGARRSIIRDRENNTKRRGWSERK